MEVRACTAGCSTPAVRAFTVQLPTVPAAASVIAGCTVASVAGQNSLTCNWSPVANADIYVIQVIQAGAGPGGGALTVASRQVSATNASFLVPAGSLSVLVQGCNGDGCGPNSPAFAVTGSFGNANAPNLGSPIGGSTVNGPAVLFSWNRIPGDNGSNTVYRLYVQDFARNQPALDIVTNQNFWGAQFAPGRRYDVLVIANPNSANPVQGPPQGFTTRGASPLSPTLVSPQHQGSVRQGNVRLGWTPLPGGQLYQYYIARQGAATAAATGVTTGIEAQVPLQVLNGQDTVHNGIVRVCNIGLACSADSETGWGIWSNATGGAGVTTFTLTP